MAGRVKRLDSIIAKLDSISFDYTQFPATDEINVYKRYLSDSTVREFDGNNGQSQNGKLRVGLEPFGFPTGTEYLTQVSVSNRAYTYLQTLAFAVELGLTAPGASLANYQSRPGFKAAKVTLAKRESVTSVAKDKNKVTGRAYKKRTGETYTLPFGRTAGTDTEFEIQQEILAAASATHALSFGREGFSRKYDK